jgi:hypothetical protein
MGKPTDGGGGGTWKDHPLIRNKKALKRNINKKLVDWIFEVHDSDRWPAGMDIWMNYPVP